MGGKSSAPAADPQIGFAALMQAQTGQQWLATAQQQFGISNERQKGIDALTEQVTRSQLDAQTQANKWAAEDRSRYKSVFLPMEDQYIETANNWASPEKQAEAAAEARADVTNAAAAQQQQRQRSMAAMGVAPDSGRFTGTERAADMDVALSSAGAQNNARTQLRNQGVALKADAINMGKGLPSQATSTLGLGVQSGSSAANTAVTGAQNANSNFQTVASGYSGAMQGWGGMANTLNQQYQNKLQAWQASSSSNNAAMGDLLGGVGSIAGLALFSSKDVKTDKRPAKRVLGMLREMPVENWTYKDGVADGGEHIGPYAEDFQKATGLGDGKTINVVDAIGVTMGAVQELAGKVDKLGRKIGRGAGPRPGADDGAGANRPAGARGVIFPAEGPPRARTSRSIGPYPAYLGASK